MREENIFFLKAEEFCNRKVQTCLPSDSVAEVARRMSEINVSSVVVCDEGRPIGIITDRDFRNKIIPSGMNAREIRAAGIMNSPLITVKEDDYLFEAVYRMSRYNIHRVGVVSKQGELCGIITDSDVIKLQTNTPQQLIRDLEHAETLEEFRRIYRKVVDLVVHLSRTGVKTIDLVRLISHINDAMVLRLIAALKDQEFPELPEGFAFIVLGSEGRQEQTLKTDQDNAIVYADDLGERERGTLEAFSARLIDSLIEIGVPPCPGGIMAKNAFWRQSLAAWVERVSEWTSVPSPENILNFSMFSDLRTLFGDLGLENAVREQIGRHVRENSVFLAHMAKNILGFSPPLGFFGGLKTEKSGEYRGKLDIKKAGIFAVTEGTKLLALSGGIPAGSTWQRIQSLSEAGEIAASEALDLQTSYNFLVFVRVRSQVNAIAAGKVPTDYVDPGELNFIERTRLKIAFSVVKSFQNLLKLRYRVDYVS